MKNKKLTAKEIFTIPNIICYVRILLIPVFCFVYLTAETQTDYFIATMIVLVSSLSDLFDGMIARKFNQVTELGKVLDPVADKLTHAALAICLAIRYPLMWALIGLMIVKEGYMAIMGLYFIKRGKMINGAMWYGKICTASLFLSLLVLFLFNSLNIIAVNVIISVVMAIMVFTLVMYIILYTKMVKDYKLEKKAEEKEITE